MPGTPSPWVKPQYFTNAGVPAAGYKLFTYAAGTSNKLATYTDVDLTVANTNPVVLDASGRCTLFLLPASYKYVFALPTDTDPPVSPVWTEDNIAAVPQTTISTDVQGFAGETLVATDCVYLSDGTAGENAGRWYKTDADTWHKSTGAKSIGFVVSGIATGSVGSIRIGGRATGFSSLTTGSAYYVSATAGAVTSTLPAQGTFYRLVGIADSITTLVLSEKAKAQTRERVATFLTPVGNVGAGEDTLFEYVAPAGEVSADGMGYHGKIWGLTANNANAKTLIARVIEGANNNVLISGALTVSQVGEWVLEFDLIRGGASGANALRSATTVSVGPANGPTTFSATNTDSQTLVWANAVTIRITGTGTANDDITAIGGRIRLIE